MSKNSASKMIGKKPDIFQSIANTIHHVTSLPVSIWAPNKDKTMLRIVAAVGLPESYVQTASLDLKKPSVTGDAFKKKKIQVAKDINSNPRWHYKEQAQEMNWKSAICVPIEVDGDSIGTISVYGYTERSISDLRHILPDFAKQIALTLEVSKQKEVLQQILVIDAKLQSMSESPKSILQAIVDGACEITGANCAVVYPFDADRDEFYDIENIASHGLQKNLKVSEKPRSKESMASYIKQKGEVTLANIETEEPAMLTTSPFIKREKVRAFMGIALKVGNDILGALYVNFRTPHNFTKQEKNTIRLFAHQASYAVNNARLYQQLGSQVKALSKLHQVAPRLVSISPDSKSLKDILKQIARDAQLVLGADLVDLYQYNQNEDDFILPPVQLGKRYTPYLMIDKILEDDVVRLVIKEGIQYVTSAQEDKSLTHSFYTRPKSPKERFVVREKLQSVASIPLAVGSELVGLLFANYRNPQTFSQQKRELIELFAGQAAIAIYNSRLYQQAKQQSETFEQLQSIGIDLVSLTGTSKDLRSTLKKIAKSAQDVLRADLVDLYQYFEELDEFDLPPIQSGKRYEPQVKKEKIQQDDVILSIVKSKQTNYILDSQASKNLTTPFSEDRTGLPASRFAEREKIKSTAAIPLMVGSEVVGALFANYRASQTFSSQQKNLIELFAAQAAIAIHNSRLYGESLQRSKRLELVRNVAAAVSSATDVKTILQLAVDGLAKVIDVKQSAVALFDEAGEYSTVWVEYLKSGCISAMGHRIPLKNNPQIDKILETKQPLIVDDVPSDPIMDQARKIMGIRKTLSIMVVPIIIDDKVVGTIGVDAVGQKRHFTSEEAQLAQAIADQTATALRIAKQLDERLNDFHALQDISEQMLQGDLDVMLDLIAERAIRLTGAKYGGVWLVNKARTALEFGGHANKTLDKQLPPNIPLDKKSENSFSKWVVLNGKSYLSGDVREDNIYKPWYEDTHSELTVPIIYKNKVIGTINVESPKKNSFTKNHKRLLEAMAGQAASMVRNARLLERLNILDDIGVELTSGIHLKEEEILESIHKQSQRLTGTQDMFVALYSAESGEIRFPLATGKGRRVEYPNRKANMEKRGKTEEIIFTHKPILHKTEKEAGEWYKQSGHEEFVGVIPRSWLGVPMVVGERVLGVLAVYDLEQEHSYDEQDLQVFSSMASQAAIALDNATLYYDVNQKLERRVKALAILNDIGRELTSGIRLKEEEILESIRNQAQQLTGAQDMYIALYNEESKEIRFPLATKNGERIEVPTRKANMEKRGKTEEIIFTREPILHKTKKEEEEWYGQPGHEKFVGLISPSWLGVPMIVGERVLGVLAVYDLKEHAYDEQDLQVFSSMSSQAAIALDNARLFEEARADAMANRQLATLGTAIAALEHRINNTLNIISPNVKRLRDHLSTENDPEVEEILGIIDRNTRYTSTLLNRIQTPLQEVGLINVDVNAILTDIFNRQKKEWAARTPIKLTAQLKLDSNIPVIPLPIGQISEVFSNLIDNAYRALDKAYRNGETVKKSAKMEVITKIDKGDTIKVQVIDNVPDGIPLPVREKLFGKPVPSRTPGEGSGLGLWLSKLIMQRIGGNIRIEDTGPDGTTMLVEIPLPK